MEWREVCEHSELRDLPFKIELNERGQIVMSPVKVFHSLYQGEIGHLLRSFMEHGMSMSECAIRTRKGTKVMDVAWVSPERLAVIRHEVECSVAPEICVEVVTCSKTGEEITEKRDLYFEKGAHEVWFCFEDGSIHFFDAKGAMERSRMIPGFPTKMNI